MSELLETPAVVESPDQDAACANHAPVLITEQQVAFGTAAALPLPRLKPTHRGATILRAMLMRSSAEAGPVTPRHYPPRRSAFMEDAAMVREMRRL